MKQPKAIIPLFFTEIWERFGYYIIQGLLVLYLTNELKFSNAEAFITLGEFLSWVYIAPVLGGIVADQLLGYRYSILLGAILLCLGYLLLAAKGQVFLHLSLATIIVGNGLLKPNNASFLGKFYYHDDPRRYPGFTFFYIGINLGGLFAILLASYAVQYIGYQAAFALAGAGMAIGIAVYIYGFRYFENRGRPTPKSQIKSPFLAAISNRFTIVAGVLILIMLIHFLLHRSNISEALLLIVALCVIVSLFYIQHSYNSTTRNQLIAVIVLIAASVVFWGLQLQIFFTIMLYTDLLVGHIVFGYKVPVPLFIILEPFFILLIGPLFAHFWRKLSEKQQEPGPSIKFALGLVIIGIAMAMLATITYFTTEGNPISPAWLVGFYLLLAISELLVTPTGLAMITELAPVKLTGFMMGVWYMVLGLGGLLAGILARLVLNDQRVELYHHVLGPYSRAFAIYAILALATGIILTLLAPKLKKLINSH